MTAVWVVAYVVLGCAGLLFLGGMLSAALEIHREKRAGVPVKRPGWRKSDRDPADEKPNYSAPGLSGFVIWPLVLVNRPDLAHAYMARRAARIARRRRARSGVAA